MATTISVAQIYIPSTPLEYINFGPNQLSDCKIACHAPQAAAHVCSFLFPQCSRCSVANHDTKLQPCQTKSLRTRLHRHPHPIAAIALLCKFETSREVRVRKASNSLYNILLTTPLHWSKDRCAHSQHQQLRRTLRHIAGGSQSGLLLPFLHFLQLLRRIRLNMRRD